MSFQGVVGGLPFAPPAPAPAPFGSVVPEPRSFDRGVDAPVTGVTVEGPEPLAALVAEGLWRVGVGPGPFPVRLALETGNGRGGDERYRVESSSAGMEVTAATVPGLSRGAATARQLFRPGWVATGRIDDEPVVPVRLLAGWGLYRDEHLEWAFEVAVEGKFNRVLYNWWGATADETLTARDAQLAEAARGLGMELVVELRRQALGPSFDVDAVLRHYDEAVEHGFTSFGFCFDDTDHDPFDTEFGLLETIVARLTQRLGAEPEFFFCPRFYWFPGQLDYSWLAAAMGPDAMAGMLGDSAVRTAEEAAQRQTEYLRRLGSILPARTHLYLANWWSGTSGEWAHDLEAGWTGLVGRPPVFWDNQQQNDYRAAAVYPLALHQRPAEMARHLAGYCLNSSRPLSAFAHSSVTAGAWAWNPDGYRAAEAGGAAVGRLYGAAAPAMLDFLGRLEHLMGALLAPRTGAEHHYRGLAKADLSAVADELDGLAAAIGEAERTLSARAHPLARHALFGYRREIDRLRLDLDVVAGDDHAVAAVEALLVARLPRAPEGQASSWRLHFVDGPMRQVRRASARA